MEIFLAMCTSRLPPRNNIGSIYKSTVTWWESSRGLGHEAMVHKTRVSMKQQQEWADGFTELNSDGIKYRILLINRSLWHYLQHPSILYKKQLLIHTLNKFVLNLYSVLQTVTGTRNTVVNKTELPSFLEITFYFEKRDNKQTNKQK